MKLLMTAACCALLANPAMAQEAEDGWIGEGSLTAGSTTGNTETTDFGLGLKLDRTSGVWTFGTVASADYAETGGAETQNRFFLSGNVDRQLNDRLFAFGQASWEQDEFSGFDSRTFVGGGLGYDVLLGPKATWSVRGGPGIKIDEIGEITSVGVGGVPIVTPAVTEESFSILGGSDYDYIFNDNVSLSNDTSVLYAETSTQLTNTTALTASLTDALSARVSFDVRHDTEPPLGFEATDTATRVSLVYGF